jgi:hypothetical protein
MVATNELFIIAINVTANAIVGNSQTQITISGYMLELPLMFGVAANNNFVHRIETK